MKITKKALAGSSCTFGNGWVSNGHWAVPLSRVENSGIFAGSTDTAAAALGIAASEVSEFRAPDAVSRILSQIDQAEPWTVSPLMRSGTGSGRIKRYGELPELRIAFSASGTVAAFDRSYCDLLGIEPGMTIWTRENCTAFLSASPFAQDRPELDEIAAVLMPFRYGIAEFSQALGNVPAAAVLAFESNDDGGAAAVLSALDRGRAAIAAEQEQAPEMTPDQALGSLGINAGALSTYLAVEQIRAAS